MNREINMVSGYLDLRKNKIYRFSLYEHIDFVRKYYADEFDEISSLFSDLDYVYKQCNELANNGDDPEWHVYEMASDDVEFDINNILISNNILRFSCSNSKLWIDSRQDVYYGNDHFRKIQRILELDDIGYKYNMISIYLNDIHETKEYSV